MARKFFPEPSYEDRKEEFITITERTIDELEDSEEEDVEEVISNLPEEEIEDEINGIPFPKILNNEGTITFTGGTEE